MLLLLIPQQLKPCWLSPDVSHPCLEHGPGKHRAIPSCSTRGCKTLGSYWLFRNVFLLLLIMYNIWRDTIFIFDLDISLASYLNNNLKNILQRKRTLFIWKSFIIILLYFIPYYYYIQNFLIAFYRCMEAYNITVLKDPIFRFFFLGSCQSLNKLWLLEEYRKYLECCLKFNNNW